MNHLELMLEAKVAINKVFSDTSVDLQVTKDSMQELSELIESNIEAIEDDMKAEEED